MSDTPADLAARQAEGLAPPAAGAGYTVEEGDGTGDVPDRRGRPGRGADGHAARALVASAARININDKRSIESAKRRRQQWQSEAWDYYDEVGELGYTVNYMANLISKVRLYAATRPDPQQPPVEVHGDTTVAGPHADIAGAVLDRLRPAQGGQSSLMKELALNFEVTGECYLHGHEIQAGDEGAYAQTAQADGQLGEDWQIRSIDELVIHNDAFGLRVSPVSQAIRPIPGTDLVIRLWERHPRYSAMATCAMRRVLSEAEALLLLSREVRATSKSRLSNGLLLLPQELSFGSLDPTRDQGDGNTGEDPFDRDLNEAMITPIQEEGSASSVVPLTIRGPAEYLKEIRHIALDRTLDPVLDSRIESRIIRIARGLNMPVEVTTGLMATTFANAAEIKKSEFEDHVEPRLVLLCDALTSGYFQWALEEAGVPPEVARTMFVWFDPSPIIADDDETAIITAAHAAGVISNQTYLRRIGFDEEDAPSKDEQLLRIILNSPRMDPFIAGQLLRMTGLAPEIVIGAPPAGVYGDTSPVSSMPAAAPAPAPVTAAGTPAQWARLGKTLSAIDRDLRNRIAAAADQAMRTALERAGSKIRGRVQRGHDTALAAAAAAVDKHHVAAALGRHVVAAAGMTEDELLAGVFDGLLGDVRAWMGQAYDRATKAVAAVAGPVDAPTAAERTVRHRANVDQAIAWLQTNLLALAEDRLYDPAGGTTAQAETGEHDPTVMVPMGLIRAAVAVAGGAQPKGGTIVAGAWATLTEGAVTDQAGNPVGGIGTGPDTMQAVGDGGGQREGWQWEYGSGVRSEFQPHLDLEGTVVASVEDEAWANNGAWPPGDFYFPGDHDGCCCDITPVLVGPDDTTATQTPEDLAARTDTATGDTSTPTGDAAAGTDGQPWATGDAVRGFDQAGNYLPSQADPATYADHYGFARAGTDTDPTRDELKAARGQLMEMRGQIREQAAQAVDEHMARLASWGSRDGRMREMTGDRHRDWFDALRPGEQQRLKLNWLTKDDGGLTDDDLAASIEANGGPHWTSEQAAAAWLDETRQIDALKQLANGKLIGAGHRVPYLDATRYGDMNVEKILNTGVDLPRIFGQWEDGADYLARQSLSGDQAATEAWSMLPRVAADQTAPWDMTEAEYVKEAEALCQQVENAVPIADDEWTGPVFSEADTAADDRLRTLMPDGYGAADGSLYSIYNELIQAAREAGMI